VAAALLWCAEREMARPADVDTFRRAVESLHPRLDT
jgi:hypothetical protein